MTNTHITVGGHKVTTNKVGQVKSVALNHSYVVDSYQSIYYVVNNGICVMTAYLDGLTTLNTLTIIATGLPKPKMEISQSTSTSTDAILLRVNDSGGEGVLWAMNTSSKIYTYFNFTYPVADDWVES